LEAQGQGCADDRGRENIVWSVKFGVRSKTIPTLLLLVILAVSSSFAAQDQQIQQKLAILEKPQGKFSFIVLGDNRSGDDIYRKLVSEVIARTPAFIVNTGDLITTPGSKEDWARFWEISKPISVPYFLTVGNHDAHPKVLGSEKIYKEQVDLPGNELYYSFVAGNSLFVVLDSCLEDQGKKIAGEQYTWLEKVLASSDKKHKFVFLHHPLYTELGTGRHAGDGLDKYPVERDRLEALFVKHKVDAVFSGHEHMYQRKTLDNITHIITGGGGAPLYTKDEAGGFNHYILVTVDNDKTSAEVIDINGKIRDRF
jgi:3',5'-cyclic AMP phosphodiesterase CpdA